MSGPIRPHVIGVVLTPLLLAVVTLRLIRGVLDEFLAVILGATAALAIGLTADDLVWVVVGRRELFLTIRTAANLHCSCIVRGPIGATIGIRLHVSPTR